MPSEKYTQTEKSLIRRRDIRSALVIGGAYFISFAVAYALFTMLSSKITVRNAVKAAQAYYDEDKRLNNLRLFGQEE